MKLSLITTIRTTVIPGRVQSSLFIFSTDKIRQKALLLITKMPVLEYSLLFIRGSGVLPKGQNSWNISVTKEARMDPKVVLESVMECPSPIILLVTKQA